MPQLEDKLQSYQDLLIKWQKSINLVSSQTLNDAQTRHFQDSLQLVQYIPDDTKTLVDLGSGAGFPALVIAMARPDIQVHCIESDQKKCSFLRTVSRETMCENVTIHCARIDDVLPELQPDLITARALASLDKLMSWVPTHGTALFPKGQNWAQEIKTAQESFSFDVQDYPSKTDPNGRILFIRNCG